MADHMTAVTAEQLRAYLREVIADLDKVSGQMPHDDTLVLTAMRKINTIAALLSGMAAVPDGYALVPIRATDEMIQSFHRGAMNAAPDGDYHGKPTVSANAMYRAGYAALLFAAPEPPRV